MFNLNNSRKPETELTKSLIKELINIYGIPCLYLYSEKVNKDPVFLDFTHFKQSNKEAKEIYLMPEDPNNWEGEESFNQFGFFTSNTQHVFITKDTIKELYPEIDESKETFRTEVLNSLLLLPSNTILEITDIQQYHEGMNNLWAYQDEITSYKLAVKVYDKNIGDELQFQGEVTLQESGDTENPEDVIFEEQEKVSIDLDDFFQDLSERRDKMDELAKETPPGANNDNVFGNLG